MSAEFPGYEKLTPELREYLSTSRSTNSSGEPIFPFISVVVKRQDGVTTTAEEKQKIQELIDLLFKINPLGVSVVTPGAEGIITHNRSFMRVPDGCEMIFLQTASIKEIQLIAKLDSVSVVDHDKIAQEMWMEQMKRMQ